MRARLGLLVLVLFIAADVVLIPMALRNTRPDQAASPVDTDQSASPHSVPSRHDSKRKKSSRPTPAGPLFMVARGKLIVSATHGDCGDAGPAAVVQVSTNGGASFRNVKVARGLEQVLGLELAPDGKLLLSAAVGNCRPRVFRSRDGTSWRAERASTLWHLSSRPARVVTAPGERTLHTPCRPTGLSTTGGAVVRVLCNDDRVLGLSSNGWVVLGRLAGAQTIVYLSPSRGLAIAPARGCPTTVFSTVDGGSSWTKATCLGEATTMGVAVDGSNFTARAGKVVLVSHDGGRTWLRQF